MVIRTPDQHLRVFVSSTLKELAEERKAVRQAILSLHLAPVMFESGARPHPAQELYQSYLSQSQVFIGIYWQSYGWVAPNASFSGLEDEYNLSSQKPRLIYIKDPAPERQPNLARLLDRIRDDNTSCYTFFSTPEELKELVQNDLALLLTEYFEAVQGIDRPTVETSHRLKTNLPVPRNPLIDREQELVMLKQLLLREDVALVTLTGAGGTGKSRLALQAGIEILEDFQDGLFLVRLESIRDTELVIATIAETLGIRETSGSRPVAEMLKAFLREKQLLLLLDNFEQVVAAAPDIADLLETCPQLKSIVTSRAPLRLLIEKELPIPPLEFPSSKSLIDLDNLSQYAAVELFIQRAQAVKPAFTITDANARAVAEICFRLDGLPLAIELAAARIKLLTPQELVSRLVHRFDILHSETRDLPERQRTLRGTIDWSYNLLNESEKQLFRRASIFVGGWSLEAAEAVCNLDADLSQGLEDILASLLDNSLVVKIQDIGDRSRFGMLKTIQDYADERLVDSGEVDAIRRQHAQYVLNFVKTIEPLIRSVDRVRWQQVLWQEFGNIRSALDWICTTGNCLEIGQQIVITFGSLWVTSGYIAEGQQWCNQIMAKSDDSTPPAIHAGLLCIAGTIAWAQGDHASAEKTLDQCLKLYRQLDSKSLEENYSFSSALMIRGVLASASGDLAVATALYQEIIDLSEETNDIWHKAMALSWLGDIAHYANEADRAAALHKQSIELARQQGDPWCLVAPLMSTGEIAVLEGDLIKARSVLEEVVANLRSTGDQWSLTWALNDLGHIMLMEDDLNQASAYFSELLPLANTLGNQRALLVSIVGTAALIAKRWVNNPNVKNQNNSDIILAARLCGATVPHMDKPGVFIWLDTKMLYEADLDQVRSLLDKDLWDQAFSEGQRLPFDQALALAIKSL